MHKVCAFCGQGFSTRSRAPERERFCSRLCYRRFWSRASAHKRRRLPDDRQRTCTVCGQAFEAPVHHPRAQTCSVPCNQKRQDARRKITRRWQPTDEMRHCVECGKAFSPKMYGGERQKFCTADCRARWNGRRYIQRTTQPVITERARRRKWNGNWWATVERDQGLCRACGIKFRSAHVHHLDGTGETETPNHALDNLVSLCAKCHMIAHRISYRVTSESLILSGIGFSLLGWSERLVIPLTAIEGVTA